MIAEAETKAAVEPSVWLHHREFVVIAVSIWQKAGCLERDARDSIVVRYIPAERDGILAGFGSGGAETVDVAVAESVPDRRMRMELAQAGVVEQHQPRIRRDLALLRRLAKYVVLSNETVEDWLDGSVTRTVSFEIDSAILGKERPSAPPVRTQEFAGMIAARDRHRVDAKRADLSDHFDDPLVGQIPGVGVNRSVTHRASASGGEEATSLRHCFLATVEYVS